MPRALNRVTSSVKTVTTALYLDQDKALWLMAECRVFSRLEGLQKDCVEAVFISEAHAFIEPER